ncbi:hypothetical protein NX862_14390 [Rhodobacter sp. KR11]|uniref:hypothetical protein n=1 Tax=Rhodobacter sp. KR11 TaxID=2974588 RepID=UPI0022231CB9|nr:hypothetical protein [Rhodobacter sp. KR11]MCW1919946.1 hypothetical protein [Rhodobacter sp. KR11]
MPEHETPLMPDLAADESRILARVFQHPLTHNLTWREVERLFGAIGSATHAPNGHLVLTVGAGRLTLDAARHGPLEPDDVMALRHFLTHEGKAQEAVTSDDLVVVIDHAEARVYPLPPAPGPLPQERHHLHHSTDRSQQDSDRDENFPADKRFFDAIATAVAGQGRIVVIGHGTGQSNEAHHLMTWLGAHRAPVHARVACTLTADLSHATLRQLLDDARQSLSATHPKGAS